MPKNYIKIFLSLFGFGIILSSAYLSYTLIFPQHHNEPIIINSIDYNHIDYNRIKGFNNMIEAHTNVYYSAIDTPTPKPFNIPTPTPAPVIISSPTPTFEHIPVVIDITPTPAPTSKPTERITPIKNGNDASKIQQCTNSISGGADTVLVPNFAKGFSYGSDYYYPYDHFVFGGYFNNIWNRDITNPVINLKVYTNIDGVWIDVTSQLPQEFINRYADFTINSGESKEYYIEGNIPNYSGFYKIDCTISQNNQNLVTITKELNIL